MTIDDLARKLEEIADELPSGEYVVANADGEVFPLGLSGEIAALRDLARDIRFNGLEA